MIDDSHALDRRRALLVAALGFCNRSEDREARTPDPETPLTILRAWLSSWRGIGLVAAGMARQGFDLSLTRYADFGWRATFYVTGREHSPTGATGSAFEATPFRAVQVAAWETLTRT
jgi:hypothetical protein